MTRHLPPAESPSHLRPIPLSEGVERLSKIALRRLSQGQGVHTVRSWLGSQNTQRTFGTDAAVVVAVLIGGVSR